MRFGRMRVIYYSNFFFRSPGRQIYRALKFTEGSLYGFGERQSELLCLDKGGLFLMVVNISLLFSDSPRLS